MLSLLSDALLILATLGLASYCWVLSRRLRAFNDLDQGMGASIGALSLQVDGMKAALAQAQNAKVAVDDGPSPALQEGLARADDAVARLEMLIAAAEDVERGVPPDPHTFDDRDVLSFRASRGSAARGTE